MSDFPHDEATILARLREAWDQALQAGEDVTVRIQLLTPDGQPGQPLAYDIVERTEGSLATYTLVELPESVNEWLGLDAVGPNEARAALSGLASEARDATLDEVTAEITETVIGAFRPGERLGVTWGYHRLADGGALLFPTDYRHWFASERLLAAQHDATGAPWARARLTLAADGSVSVSFE